MQNAFEHLIVIGRPACGKSEFIDFIKNKISQKDLLEKLHIAPFEELDDFVWLWKKFQEDDIWEAVGENRLYSVRSGHAYLLTDRKLFDFLIEKFNTEISSKFLARPTFYSEHTLLIEFSRGTDTGYKNALNRLSKDVLSRAAIFYIEVSFEESVRRNEARYQEKLKHSILAHKVPDDEINNYYRVDDWRTLTGARTNGYLELHGLKVPFVTMNNEPESKDAKALEIRYGEALRKLFELFSNPKEQSWQTQ